MKISCVCIHVCHPVRCVDRNHRQLTLDNALRAALGKIDFHMARATKLAFCDCVWRVCACVLACERVCVCGGGERSIIDVW